MRNERCREGEADPPPACPQQRTAQCEEQEHPGQEIAEEVERRDPSSRTSMVRGQRQPLDDGERNDQVDDASCGEEMTHCAQTPPGSSAAGRAPKRER